MNSSYSPCLQPDAKGCAAPSTPLQPLPLASFVRGTHVVVRLLAALRSSPLRPPSAIMWSIISARIRGKILPPSVASLSLILIRKKLVLAATPALCEQPSPLRRVGGFAHGVFTPRIKNEMFGGTSRPPNATRFSQTRGLSPSIVARFLLLPTLTEEFRTRTSSASSRLPPHRHPPL